MGRMIGAAVRVLVVGVMLTLTIAAMPDVNPATADGFGLVTIAVCAFVLLEYGFRQPALLEFRFAAPYNRWRFLTMILIILGFVVLCGNVVVETPYNYCVLWLAEWAQVIFGFPGSPSNVMSGLLSGEVTEKAAAMIVPMASLGYLIALLSLVIFAIYLSFSRWPARFGSFHFWSNLPTFQTVQPENARKRLFQVGLLSSAMAIVLPYFIPYFVKSFSDILPISSFVGDFTLFWLIAFCTWLPLACGMRSFALLKVAFLIGRDDDQ